MAHKSTLALLSFVAACVFLGCATFGVALSDIPLIAAGLFCMAIGFALQSAP